MNNVKYLMKQKGLTIVQLSNRMGVQKSELSTLFKSGNPSRKTLSRIAQALDVELWELFIPRTTTRPQKVIEVKCPACQSNVKFRVSMSVKAGEVGGEKREDEQ